VAADEAGCEYVNLRAVAELDAAAIASDGFHPGPLVYTLWAAAVADRIRALPAS
jgi:lysophospholipase L1-like esterase